MPAETIMLSTQHAVRGDLPANVDSGRCARGTLLPVTVDRKLAGRALACFSLASSGGPARLGGHREAALPARWRILVAGSSSESRTPASVSGGPGPGVTVSAVTVTPSVTSAVNHNPGETDAPAAPGPGAAAAAAPAVT